MNDQQLQQLFTIQQAIAAAATAAVINSLLNPQQQQAAGLNPANALSDSSSNDLQLALQQLQQQHQQQQQQQQHHQQDNGRRDSPSTTTTTTSPLTATNPDCNNRIQDLLMQIQQQASMGQSPVALNLNLATQHQQHQQQLPQGLNTTPIRSPVSRLSASAQDLNSAATTSNTHSQTSPSKKLKTRHQPSPQQHNQQPPFNHNRSSSEATSKPQHLTPKNHSTITNLSAGGGRNTGSGSQNTSSSTSSAFLANNVGLPRKLVRGQDVWLGRGAEQTRQILKCMWCGQSFRTLAEMTQHMKITQHYTNIISQEQITSWRQPESSDANNKHSNKQSIQSRGLEDNHDDHSSDKFNDSDREDSFSNDDDLDQQQQQQQKHPRQSSQNSTSSSGSRLVDHAKGDSADNNSTTGSIHDDHQHSPNSRARKGSPSSKPLTRSRKRENEILPIKRNDELSRENSPETSSSSQARQSNNNNSSSSSTVNINTILGNLNEDFETNKECKTNGSPKEQPELSTTTITTKIENNDDDPDDDDDNNLDTRDDDENRESNEDSLSRKEKKSKDLVFEEESDAVDNHENDNENDDDPDADDHDDALPETDDADDGIVDHHRDVDEEQASETNESAATTTSGLKSSLGGGGGQKGETGDPLSALETMVEKSFDPRMRPGVANGGILQRLGIDEEVCPPWQHINYANWYAAAAYGHPMAAALLAAGINLQNGIKLSKNVTPKKNED